MTIAVFGRSAKAENLSALKLLLKLAKEKSMSVVVVKSFADMLAADFPKISQLETANSSEEVRDKAKYLFSIGGDGTLLNTVQWSKDGAVPVVGINTGRLGFLANFSVEEIPLALDLIENGSYLEDQRTLLKAECNVDVFDGPGYALNEFTIQKQDPSAVIKIKAYVNGVYLGSYYSDGLIISTPTGSTGYSMSTGGSIMLPGSQAFTITPIAGHNLSMRPIIVSDNAILDFVIEERRGHSYCTLDSKFWKIDASHKFRITKANYKIKIVQQPNTTYIDTLRNKLMWGVDNRNKS